MRWFEVMNLLARHTLPFDPIPQDKFVASRDLSALDLLVILDAPDARQVGILTSFAEKGGTVVLPGIQGKFPWQSATPTAKTDTQTTYTVGKGRIVEHRDPPANPDTFALQVRQLLGRDNRVLQMWNGITVIAARYESGGTVLLTALNYAHQELPLQVRVPGKFSAVQYESPETTMTLLPYQQRDGFTEFVIPALRVGARIFLTPDAAANAAEYDTTARETLRHNRVCPRAKTNGCGAGTRRPASSRSGPSATAARRCGGAFLRPARWCARTCASGPGCCSIGSTICGTSGALMPRTAARRVSR